MNGLRGSEHYRDGNWQGFSGSDIEFVIDLEKEMKISAITIAFLQNATTWIFLPSGLSILVSSSGAEGDFKVVKEFLTSVPMETKEAMVQDYAWNFNDRSFRGCVIKVPSAETRKAKPFSYVSIDFTKSCSHSRERSMVITPLS